jgi:hypothetical protein
MADISEYTAKILDEAGRPLFQEAAASALNGAPRGAYILIWIACAEGLKRKFREAAVRDGKANKILGDIDQKEKQQKSVDMFILTSAKNYGFIDDVTFQKLEYIYKMRCVYGHPYESAPDDAELTNAAAVVVGEVLEKPTLLRHGFVQTLIEKLFSDVNYLEQSETSVRSFASEISARIDPIVYGYVLEKYTEKLESSLDDASLEIVVERGLWFLSEFLLNVGCNFYSPAQWHDFAAKCPKTTQQVILSNGRLFEAVGERARDYIVSYDITHADTHPSRLKDVEKLFDEGLLSDDQKRKLQSLDIRVIKAANLRISTCYDIVISALESHDWHQQNPAVDLISSNDKSEIARLSPEQQEELGRNILQAADGSSNSAVTYLSAVRRDPSDLEHPFLKGLIFEAFVNERLEFRLKKERMSVILDLLTKQKDIEAELVEAIDTSKPKSWIYENTYQHVLDLVKKRPGLQLLAGALERNSERLTNLDNF